MRLFCKSNFLVALFVCFSFIAFAKDIEQQPVFLHGKDGYDTYRIPSLLTTVNGTLLAFCEGRKNGFGDSGDIDLLLKRSSDNGKTWSPQAVVWNDGTNTCGNPCVVQDRDTKTIFLLATHNLGKDQEKEINAGTSTGTRTVWLSESKDDGKSWSAPREITSEVKDPSWRWYATGPGIGIQIEKGEHKGRLVIPCDHSVVNNGKIESRSHVIYSDDHGKTWKRGDSVRPAMNECQVVELSNPAGSLLLSMRNLPRGSNRAQSISQDGGATWSEPVRNPALLDPTCEASVIRYTGRMKKPTPILFSNPADSDHRKNLTVRGSFDDGKTWPVSVILEPNDSAYSCLATLRDGTLGCLYEAGGKRANQTITFARFPLSVLK